MKYYLGGPMSHIKGFNYEAFDSTAAVLRNKGYEIVNPAELDDPEVKLRLLASEDGVLPLDHKWGDFITRDLKLVIDEVDGVIFLKGWQKSRGSLLEALAAFLCEKPIYWYDGGNDIQPIDYLTLRLAWFKWQPEK